MYKPDNISSTEELYEEVKEIHNFLLIPYDPDSGKECTDRAALLSSYVSRTSKMLSDAKFHKDSIMLSEIMKILNKQYQELLSASTINKLLDAACKDINYLLNWIEETHKAAKAQIELMRSLISQAKEIYVIESRTQNVQNNS